MGHVAMGPYLPLWSIPSFVTAVCKCLGTKETRCLTFGPILV